MNMNMNMNQYMNMIEGFSFNTPTAQQPPPISSSINDLKTPFSPQGQTPALVSIKDGADTQVPLKTVLDTEFAPSSYLNPFGNVLLPEIKYDRERLAAPPSFNVDVSRDITKNIKKMVQFLNPGIKNSSHQLFGDLYENFLLDDSSRVFFSTANTRVTNDQGAFGKFLYGYMPSGKESNFDSGIQRFKDAYRYTLY